MNKLRKKLFIILIFLIALVTGAYIQSTDQRSYVLEMKNEEFQTPEIADNVIPTESEPEAAANAEETPEPDEQEVEKININTASKEELKKLESIGDVKAERIIKYREEHGGFEVIEDIRKIEGIGTKTFNKIKDKITVK